MATGSGSLSSAVSTCIFKGGPSVQACIRGRCSLLHQTSVVRPSNETTNAPFVWYSPRDQRQASSPPAPRPQPPGKAGGREGKRPVGEPAPPGPGSRRLLAELLLLELLRRQVAQRRVDPLAVVHRLDE